MNSKFKFLTKNILPTTKIEVKKAKGFNLWDTNNKEYLDFSSQTLNLNFGNSPVFVKKAFLNQFKKYTFLSTRFINKEFIKLSKMLVDIAPKRLIKVNIKLTNGSDANESAIKRARIYRKKPFIVSFINSHIGESSETLNASKHLINTFYGGSNYFIFIEPPYAKSYSDEKSLNEVEILFKKRNDIAAIIIEPIVVNAGVQILSVLFLKKLRSLCNKYKVTLIFDEIQTAFGWLGKFFAANYFNITPDILTIGKALASGFPLAGILMKKEYDVLDYGLDEFTYGGHSISCAVAIENINLLKKTNILKQVKEKSTYFNILLNMLLTSNKKIIKKVRICGLIAGIEFQSNQNINMIFDTLLKNGLIVRKASNSQGLCLILKPPIIVDKKILNKAYKIIDKTLKSL